MSNVDLVGHNKLYLYVVVGAPSSTHIAGILKSTDLYKNKLRSQNVPGRTIYSAWK